MNNKHQVYLHIGSNKGNRLKYIKLAKIMINEKIGTVKNTSKIYETKAWGKTDQPDFLNQAFEVTSALSPEAILDKIVQIENKLGRIRDIRWGPRTLDVDILFYNDDIVEQERLTIPHPLLHERQFVLQPLMDICPDFKHPVLKKTIRELTAHSNDKLMVAPIG